MWQTLSAHLPSVAAFICAGLSVIILGGIAIFNQFLHKWGDPPWKKEEEQNRKEQIRNEGKLEKIEDP